MEQAADHEHRSRAQAIARLGRAIADRTAKRAVLVGEQAEARGLLEVRFGRAIPWDDTGLLYDVLARVEVMPDGGWRWLGGANNAGLATVRHPGSNREVSVRRFLAITFGVIDPEAQVLLRGDSASRRCGYLDVSPFRCVPSRPYPDGKKLGNPRRFPTQQ